MRHDRRPGFDHLGTLVPAEMDKNLGRVLRHDVVVDCAIKHR
jgi:hypothetical protein